MTKTSFHQNDHILEVQLLYGFYGLIFLGGCGSTPNFIFTFFNGAKYKNHQNDCSNYLSTILLPSVWYPVKLWEPIMITWIARVLDLGHFSRSLA
ncbi:MAG: hypothetical protein DRR19_00515 [Candidatus Parabeggiatoa sp. nov. 1]|nr:MAG: hypothetical protein DRR19_00515 [Gammaproteobacteria bacterium]